MALILSGDTGPSFVQDAAMPSGSVLQVVSSSTFTTDVTTTSSTYIATGLTATITPISATSKILVMLSGSRTYQPNGSRANVTMYRKIGSASYSQVNSYLMEEWEMSGGGGAPHSMNFLDSPATTSEIVYQPYIKSVNGGLVYFADSPVNRGSPYLILMEIQG